MIGKNILLTPMDTGYTYAATMSSWEEHLTGAGHNVSQFHLTGNLPAADFAIDGVVVPFTGIELGYKTAAIPEHGFVAAAITRAATTTIRQAHEAGIPIFSQIPLDQHLMQGDRAFTDEHQEFLKFALQADEIVIGHKIGIIQEILGEQ